MNDDCWETGCTGTCKKGESERGGTRKKKYRLQEEEAAARDIVKIKKKS